MTRVSVTAIITLYHFVPLYYNDENDNNSLNLTFFSHRSDSDDGVGDDGYHVIGGDDDDDYVYDADDDDDDDDDDDNGDYDCW